MSTLIAAFLLSLTVIPYTTKEDEEDDEDTLFSRGASSFLISEILMLFPNKLKEETEGIEEYRLRRLGELFIIENFIHKMIQGQVTTTTNTMIP
jgi:hypothetical protein